MAQDDKKIFWWLQETKKHEAVGETISQIRKNQATMLEEDYRSARLYGGKTYSYGTIPSVYNIAEQGLTLNVVRSMIDTATNKISKNKIKPSFLTEGGNWEMQEKAKRLNKLIQGQFYAINAYQKGQEVFRDAGVWGSGFAKFYRVGKKICKERVMAPDIITDENEGQDPRSIYQIKEVPKVYLKALYPKFAKEIQAAENAYAPRRSNHQNLSDFCLVMEAWHLPSEYDMDVLKDETIPTDGRHVLAISNATFIDEEYRRPRFPFAKFDWSKPLTGYRGQGIAKMLTPLQIEINRCLITIQTAMRLCNIPRVYLEMASEIVKSQITNEIGSVVWFSGNKPIIESPSAVSPQLFEWLNYLFQRAFDEVGISQLMAQGQKPMGLDSGKAIREFSDIQTDRFAVVEQDWEKYYLDCAEQVVDLTREIAEEYGDYEIMSANTKDVEIVNWKDISLEEDKYIMKVFPTNYLSETPAGKLQDVIELSQAGLIDPASAHELLDFPDLEAYNNRVLAPRKNIEHQINQIIYHGNYMPPEPAQDLVMGMKMMTESYLWGRAHQVPPSRLDLLRKWISTADAIIKAQAENMQMQQQAMQPQLPTQAQAAPQPVSDLLPQVV